MPAKIRSAGNLSQNPQEAVIATYVCFLTNFTELEQTYRPIIGGAKCIVAHPTKILWAMAHPTHAAAPAPWS